MSSGYEGGLGRVPSDLKEGRGSASVHESKDASRTHSEPHTAVPVGGRGVDPHPSGAGVGGVGRPGAGGASSSGGGHGHGHGHGGPGGPSKGTDDGRYQLGNYYVDPTMLHSVIYPLFLAYGPTVCLAAVLYQGAGQNMSTLEVTLTSCSLHVLSTAVKVGVSMLRGGGSTGSRSKDGLPMHRGTDGSLVPSQPLLVAVAGAAYLASVVGADVAAAENLGSLRSAWLVLPAVNALAGLAFSRQGRSVIRTVLFALMLLYGWGWAVGHPELSVWDGLSTASRHGLLSVTGTSVYCQAVDALLSRGSGDSPGRRVTVLNHTMASAGLIALGVMVFWWASSADKVSDWAASIQVLPSSQGGLWGVATYVSWILLVNMRFGQASVMVRLTSVNSGVVAANFTHLLCFLCGFLLFPFAAFSFPSSWVACVLAFAGLVGTWCVWSTDTAMWLERLSSPAPFHYLMYMANGDSVRFLIGALVHMPARIFGMLASWIAPHGSQFHVPVTPVMDHPDVLVGVAYFAGPPEGDVRPDNLIANIGHLKHGDGDWHVINYSTIDMLKDLSRGDTPGFAGDVVAEFPIYGMRGSLSNPFISCSKPKSYRQMNISAWKDSAAAHDWYVKSASHKDLVKRYHTKRLQSFSAMLSSYQPTKGIRYQVRCEECLAMVKNWPENKTCRACGLDVKPIPMF